MSALVHGFHAARARASHLVVLALLVACAPRAQSRGPNGEAPAPAQREPLAPVLDPTAGYRGAGLIVQGPPLPFVGAVRYLAGRTADSTLVLVTLSLANRSLTFTSDGSGQRAEYAVLLDLQQGGVTAKHSEARETVRVASFKETTRSDESIVFQQFVTAAPGQYTLGITVRDQAGTNAAVQQIPVSVPRMGSGALSSLVPVHQATPRTTVDSTPLLIANSRATVVFGRDSLAPVYVEGYGLPSTARVAVAVLANGRAPILRDTVSLARFGSLAASVLNFPVPRLGVGRLEVAATVVGTADSATTPLLVTFGDELGIMSFDELLSYLRYYATPERLQPLRDSLPERRAEAWAEFWKSSDPTVSTAEHEGLREYFARIQMANQRFREEGGPGWLTDRGKVYITLGEPDQLLEQGGPGVNTRGRAQVWEYGQYHMQLVFVDQTGFGRWRLTPASEAQFEQIARRERLH
jgi:GWxTD domain-containing protein